MNSLNDNKIVYCYVKNKINMREEVKLMLMQLHARIIEKNKEGNDMLNKMLLAMSSAPGFNERVQEGEIYHNQASVHYNQGQYEKAFELFSMAIEKYPNAGSYYSRGTTAMDLRDYKRAIADFTSAIQFEDNYVNAYHNRALCFLELLDSFELMNDSECKELVNFARNDLQIAIKLGHPNSQQYLEMSYR